MIMMDYKSSFQNVPTFKIASSSKESTGSGFGGAFGAGFGFSTLASTGNNNER